MLITFQLCSIQNIFFSDHSHQTFLDIMDLSQPGQLRIKTAAVAYSELMRYENAIGSLTMECSCKYFPVVALQSGGETRTRQVLEMTVTHFVFTPAKIVAQDEKPVEKLPH